MAQRADLLYRRRERIDAATRQGNGIDGDGTAAPRGGVAGDFERDDGVTLRVGGDSAERPGAGLEGVGDSSMDALRHRIEGGAGQVFIALEGP